MLQELSAVMDATIKRNSIRRLREADTASGKYHTEHVCNANQPTGHTYKAARRPCVL